MRWLTILVSVLMLAFEPAGARGQAAQDPVAATPPPFNDWLVALDPGSARTRLQRIAP